MATGGCRRAQPTAVPCRSHARLYQTGRTECPLQRHTATGLHGTKRLTRTCRCHCADLREGEKLLGRFRRRAVAVVGRTLDSGFSIARASRKYRVPEARPIATTPPETRLCSPRRPHQVHTAVSTATARTDVRPGWITATPNCRYAGSESACLKNSACTDCAGEVLARRPAVFIAR
jgi:hypothetical protein